MTWSSLVLILTLCVANICATIYPKNTCGLRPLVTARDSTAGRVVGGTIAKVGDWPWAISMLLNGRHVCGGSLINDQWIVTAAHCIGTNTNPASYRILFGLHDRLNQENWVLSRNVQRIVVHPRYVSSRFLNDIALMQLSTKIDNYTEYYMPVCFPKATQTFANQIGYTVGWGAQFYGGSITRELMQVATTIVTDAVCQSRYTAGTIDTTIQICSGGNNQGACQGDSGGPFTVADSSNGGRHTLAGITSWGIGCGNGGVYARASAYRSWVESTIGSTLP